MPTSEDPHALVNELREIHARSRENAREQGWGVPPEAEDVSPWSRAADMIEELAKAAEPEWEYGYISPWRDDNHMIAVQRKPDNWYGQERPIYRRRCAVPPGEWEIYDGPVTMELAHRPWLRPGGDPSAHPAYNRSPHRETPEWTFAPGKGYEQDIEKYGFRYAPCGRTAEHFPHSALDGTGYCNGVPR